MTTLARMKFSELMNFVWPGVTVLGSNLYEWMPEIMKNLSNLHMNSLGELSCEVKSVRCCL